MTDDTPSTERPAAAQQAPAASPQSGYVVVARRYRPQTFDDLVGQEHVGRALVGAIDSGRVGHAYLFAGARGVGKTSAARILAKALNCERGPGPVPCNACDVCQAVSEGEDVDVLEIDGASNRGIDEIRQLRQNVNVRPSRARLKIYIIDEVHMLTREAFNALLKTLEEPPRHVKFIFCTTEPGKVPVTIQSRCQRFDFAGIGTAAIARRLAQIVAAEGVTADPDALDLLARRAGGSMRDSQSLLEQLLAFSSTGITVDAVHGMLGTADSEQIARLAGHLLEHRPAEALALLDQALDAGVDAGQLLGQLVEYLRDCLVAAAGCATQAMRFTAAADYETVAAVAGEAGIDTLLAAMQILDQALMRLRTTSHGRTLCELALVRIARLDQLDELAGLVARLEPQTADRQTAPPAAGRATATRSTGPKKKFAAGAEVPAASAAEVRHPMATPPPGSASGTVSLTAETASDVWRQVLANLSDMTAGLAADCDVATPAPNHLVVSFRASYSKAAFSKRACERPDRLERIRGELATLCGQPIRVEFVVADAAAAGVDDRPRRNPARRNREQLREAAEHPWVQRAAELFGAEPVRVEEPEDQNGTP